MKRKPPRPKPRTEREIILEYLATHLAKIKIHVEVMANNVPQDMPVTEVKELLKRQTAQGCVNDLTQLLTCELKGDRFIISAELYTTIK